MKQLDGIDYVLILIAFGWAVSSIIEAIAKATCG